MLSSQEKWGSLKDKWSRPSITACSLVQKEAAHLSDDSYGKKVSFVQNGIDLDFFRPREYADQERTHDDFHGSHGLFPQCRRRQIFCRPRAAEGKKTPSGCQAFDRGEQPHT